MVGTSRQGPRIITVGGGKGGVGKSVVAANLALALAQAGTRVVLVDADLGAANQHTLFGIDQPARGLIDVLEKRVARLDDATTGTAEANLRLVVGVGAVPGAANPNHARKQKLLRQIRALDTEIVVVDVGAGSAHNIVDLYDAGDTRVLVVTPQLTSIQNAYAFLKAALVRHFFANASTKEESADLEAAMSSRETERIDEALQRLAERNQIFSQRLRSLAQEFDTRLCGNMLEDPARETGIFHGVARMVRDFLGVSMPLLGCLPRSPAMHQQVNRRAPLLLAGEEDDTTRALRAMARALRLDLPRTGPAASKAAPASADDNDLGRYLRRHPRIEVTWPAAIVTGGRAIPARVLDVSLGGAALVTQEPLAEGTDCALILHQPAPPLRVRAVVRNVNREKSRVGIEFRSELLEAHKIVRAAQLQGEPPPRA